MSGFFFCTKCNNFSVALRKRGLAVYIYGVIETNAAIARTVLSCPCRKANENHGGIRKCKK